MQYAYLITRTDPDPDRPDDRRVLSRGVESDPCGQGPKVLAEMLLTRNRVEHGHYTGPRRCAIWPLDADETPLPRVAPPGAETYDG